MKRLLLFTLVALAAITATADAATINVRIEGQSSTLFEGPIVTKGRNVQSLSERATGAIRRCDGTNNGGTLAPTGTAATVDALSRLGKGFDGQWYDEYEDYLISRLADETRSWRLFRNEDVHHRRRLSAAAGRGRPRAVGRHERRSPAAVDHGIHGDHGRRAPPCTWPARTARRGGCWAPPTASGQRAAAPDLAGAWHRIKATKAGMVRSARVDYCPSACPAQKPADMQPRTPPAPVFYGPGGAVIPGSPALATETTAGAA